MMRIAVSMEARKDLLSIRRYIQDDLANPDAAQRRISSLKKSILNLKISPNRGRTLDTLISVHTDDRYTACENYCIFCLMIIRILYQRQNCLKTLLFER